MKSKRFLAMLLSIAMLISSWSLFVLADGDGSPDGDISSGDTENPGDSLDALKLDELFEAPMLDYGSTYAVTFTPDQDGEYTLTAVCVNGSVITVSDPYGSAVTPVSSNNYEWTYVMNLRLSAGKTYTITFQGGSFGLDSPFTLYMSRTAKTLSLGRNTFFARGGIDTYIPFTPDVSGTYIFTESHHSFSYYGDSEPGVNLSVTGGCYISPYYSDTAHIAHLTAGTTYNIRFHSDAPKIYGSIMTLDITRDVPELSEGRTDVTVPISSGYAAYTFSPSKTGVYVFYAEGQYSTSINVIKKSAIGTYSANKSAGSGAGGYNFLLPVALEAGEEYYVIVKGSSEDTSDITFPVTLKYEEPKGTGQYDSPAGDRYLAYYPFRAEESGYYMFLCPNGYVSAESYIATDLGYGDQRVYYVEKGKDIVLSYFRYEDTPPVSFEVRPLEKTLSLGENTLTKEINKQMYAKFTPEVSGTYTITIPENFPASPQLCSADRNSVYSMNHKSDDNHYTYSLIGGEPYLLWFNLEYNDSVSEVTLKLEKTPPPMLGMGKNTVPADKAFSFTPKESGMYQFYNHSNVRLTVYHGPKYLGASMSQGDYDSGFSITGAQLTAYEEYTLVPSYNDDFNSDSLDIFVEEVPQLKIGENEVSKAGVFTETTFIPNETGIYVVSCEDGTATSFQCLSGTGFSGISTNFRVNDKIYVLLEKDYTYNLEFKSDPANTSDKIHVNIEKERVLEMGRNEDVLVKKSEDNNTCYTYYSFIPEKNGTYTFRTENGENVNAFVYEKLDKKNEIGRGYVSWTDYNMNMTVTLEAGKLYHVQMCIEDSAQQEQDALADLIIEETPVEKLSGYSLSLDGSIAVNLYLSLADFVAESKTAILHCTFPNGKEIDYKMDDADIKMLNNQKYYVFHLPVAPKEMVMDINAQLIDEANGIVGEKYSVSVESYASYLFSYAYDSNGNVLNKEFAAAVPLVKALLNYGARAQTYFNHVTYRLANWQLSAKERVLPNLNPDSIPKYVMSGNSEKLPDGLTFDGASLSIESETELNLYFTNKTGKKVVFSEPGRGIETQGRKSGGSTIVKINGIPAHKLDEVIRVEVSVEGDPNTYFVTYSPIFYCHNVIEREISATRTENLKELMKAFYFYNQAAKNYLGE